LPTREVCGGAPLVTTSEVCGAPLVTTRKVYGGAPLLTITEVYILRIPTFDHYKEVPKVTHF